MFTCTILLVISYVTQATFFYFTDMGPIMEKGEQLNKKSMWDMDLKLFGFDSFVFGIDSLLLGIDSLLFGFGREMV